METKDTRCNPRTLNRNQECWMETKNTGSNQGYQFKTKDTEWKPRILDVITLNRNQGC